MEELKKEKKVKISRDVLIIVIAVLVVGAVALGFMYYTENQDKKSLAETNEELQDRYEEINAKLEGEVTDLTGGAESLTGEKTTLASQNATLKAENDEYAAGMVTVKAYNDIFKHYNTVLETHGGFSGWTDAEFEAGKALAELTGSTAFVSTVNWAWYETSVPAFDRVLRYQKEIAAGIEGGIK